METVKVAETEGTLVASLTLLSMGIKSVPQAVLRKQFSDAASTFIEILEKNAQTENGSLLRSVIGCLSVLLRAQEYALWSESYTVRVFDLVLAFALHAKPKVSSARVHPARPTWHYLNKVELGWLGSTLTFDLEVSKNRNYRNSRISTITPKMG